MILDHQNYVGLAMVLGFLCLMWLIADPEDF
jgi:hypothetical protein